MYYLIPLGMFLLIEFYFVIAFYQVFRHFPWNLGTTESMMFGWFSLLAFIFIAVAWSNLRSYNGGTTDVDDMHPDELAEIEVESFKRNEEYYLGRVRTGRAEMFQAYKLVPEDRSELKSVLYELAQEWNRMYKLSRRAFVFSDGSFSIRSDGLTASELENVLSNG